MYDWAEVLPHGMISDLVNETGLLTPDEARAKAANLIAAADEVNRRNQEHIPSSDCWCKPQVEYVPPRHNVRDDVGPLDEYRGQ